MVITNEGGLYVARHSIIWIDEETQQECILENRELRCWTLEEANQLASDYLVNKDIEAEIIYEE